MMPRKQKYLRVLIHLSILAAYFFAGFVLEFTHQHAFELNPISDSQNQQLKDDPASATSSKLPCTACRLSRDRLSIEPRVPLHSNVETVSSHVLEVCFSSFRPTLFSAIGSRAPPASLTIL